MWHRCVDEYMCICIKEYVIDTALDNYQHTKPKYGPRPVNVNDKEDCMFAPAGCP